MRKAVNYAIDRTAYADAGRPVRGVTVRPVAPAGHARVRGHRRLSGSSRHRASARPCRLASRRPAAADHRLLPLERDDQPGAVPDRQADLEHIGFDVTASASPAADIYTAMGIRGEPFDLGVSVGWCADYNDPWDCMLLFDGTTDPGRKQRQLLLLRRPGLQRADARGEGSSSAMSVTTPSEQIEHDLVRDAAPWASMRTYNNRYLFSAPDRLPALPTRPSSAGSISPPLRAAGDHDRRQARASSRSGRRRPRSGAAQQRDGQHDHGRLRDRRRDRARRGRLRRDLGDADVRPA